MHKPAPDSRTDWVGVLISWFILTIVTGIAIGPYAPIDGAALVAVSSVIAAAPMTTLYIEGWI